MVNLKKIFGDVVSDKERTIPGKADIIKTARERGRLLAVRGSYDYVEKILPYCYTKEKVLANPDAAPPALRDFDVIFVGCPGKLNPSRWRKPLRSFVQGGGYLVTTDWCLANLVEPTFPGKIARSGSASGSFALRVREPQHPLLAGIEDCGGTPWVVETASHCIDVRDAKGVTVVLDAPEMGPESAVLVAFPVGEGMVVHAISHFHLQGSEARGEYVSAYLLTNVIDEAVRARYGTRKPRIRTLGSRPARPAARPLRIRLIEPG